MGLNNGNNNIESCNQDSLGVIWEQTKSRFLEEVRSIDDIENNDNIESVDNLIDWINRHFDIHANLPQALSHQ